MTFDPLASPRILCLDLRGDRPRPTVPPPRVILCLGNFDGVHLAHQRLLQEGMRLSRALSVARGKDIACGVLCFFRPSSDTLSPADPPHHLTPLGEKLALLAALGMDYAYLCRFSEVRALSPNDFLDLLEARLGCMGTVCGFNHRFGAGAVGDHTHLTAHFGQDAVTVVPEMTLDGVTVSATRIRERLWLGDAEGAARLLGRPYSLNTTVTRGKQLGRALGFPTANQYFLPKALVPLHGVYAARCHTSDGIFPAVANVGCHPTVDDHARINCESYIMGYNGDLYGRPLRTELLCHLRPERRFSDIQALTAAIAHDAQAARHYAETHGLML